MAQYELRPFAMAEAETVASWALFPEDCEALLGTRELITPHTISVWRIEVDWAFTLREEGDLVAYGDLAEDDVEGDAEIAHLLVAPDHRRRGAGKVLVSRLCQFLEASRPYSEVWLRGPRQNEALLACARSCGFDQVEAKSGPRYLWLKKDLQPVTVTYDSF